MPDPTINATSNIETFGLVWPDFVIESVIDPDHPNQLRLHTWDGRKATTAPTATAAPLTPRRQLRPVLRKLFVSHPPAEPSDRRGS